jgi:hypothetical protein
VVRTEGPGGSGGQGRAPVVTSETGREPLAFLHGAMVHKGDPRLFGVAVLIVQVAESANGPPVGLRKHAGATVRLAEEPSPDGLDLGSAQARVAQVRLRVERRQRRLDRGVG